MTDTTNSDNYTASSGTITIAGGDRLILSGTANLGPSVLVSGGGMLVTSGTTSLSGLSIDGGTTLSDTGTISATAALSLAGATLRIESGGAYNISGDVGITAGSGGSPIIYNSGTLAKLSGPGVSNIAVTTVSTGTLSVADGNLRFNGVGNSFSGTYIGSGMVDYGTGSVSTLYTINMLNAACSTNFGCVNQAGTVTLGSWSTLKNLAGSTWNFTTDAGLVQAAGTGPIPTFTNKGYLDKTGGTGTTSIGISVSNEDSATVYVATGTLSFNGSSNMFSGTLTGAGGIAFGGGSITSLGAGTRADVANLAVTGTGTTVTIDTALSYGGAFSIGAGATVSVGAADALTLSGTTTLGGKLVVAGNATSRAALTVKGAAAGTGTIALNGAASVEFGSQASGQTVTFSGTDNVLKLDAPASFGGAITGFDKGDTIDLVGVTVQSLTYSGSLLTMTLANGTTQTLKLAGSSTGVAFASDGNGGTNLAASTAATPPTPPTPPASTIVTATTGADSFTFTSGTNTVNATAATLGANDSLVGGSGVDTLALSGGGSINLGGLASFRGFEQVKLAAGANYTLTTGDANVAAGQTLSIDASALGSANSLTFYGSAETDGTFSITSGAGNDNLFGSKGADTLAGGAGDDAYWINNTNDVVIEAAGAGTDSVYTTVNYTLGSGQSIEVLGAADGASKTALNLTGNDLANSIFANAGNDVLNGMGGNDWLVSGAGVDTLIGGAGDDGFLVKNAADTVIEAAGGGYDCVYAAVSYALGAGQSIEKLSTDNPSGTAAINLSGNELVQAIYGNAGSNILDGKGGNDVLTGGAGNDFFLFDTKLDATNNVAQVTDFTVKSDMIELSHSIFSALAVGGLDPTAFHVGAAATAAADRIIYNPTSGALFYDSNGSAAGGSTQFATLSAGLSLTASDFKIV